MVDDIEEILARVLDPLDARVGESWGYGRQLRGESRLPDASLLGGRSYDDPSPAGVLVPVILERGGGVSVLFTLRTDSVRDHKRQMSFPGGMAEPTDVDLLQTALRETEEEIGLSRQMVEVLGRLRPYDTITGFRIHPFVGIVRGRPALTPCATEIEQVFFVDLDVLMDPATFTESVVDWCDKVYSVRAFEWGGPVIWGATANMLSEFVERVRGA
jgi:8-oxo-dGTP pyrophosphatase MutT (NUDIX family)